MKHQINQFSIKQNFAHKVLIPIIINMAILGSNVQADQSKARDTIYFTLPPSPEVLASHLFGEAEKRPLTRSISFKKSPSTNSQTNTTPVVAQKSVTMPVLFHFGKTSITNASKPFLDNVGKMLVAESNIDRALVVEGHTDAVGSNEFNQRLSELRALAIRDYLVENYGINPIRLMPVGKGESTLYNTINPNSGENRRVEFMPYRKSKNAT